jgi:predicted homoserine dehydrogenase-like protein
MVKREGNSVSVHHYCPSASRKDALTPDSHFDLIARERDAMRLGLIGSTGHWQSYAPALEHVAGLTLVAVAPAGPEETTGAFDHAPGLKMDTRRHDDAQKMLETERLDVGAGNREAASS